MHIEKLHIQNFRGLQEIILNFPQSNLAVLVGRNGAGKSSTQTFPNCQFIVTTHSPQVLSAARRENVLILENSQLVNNTPHTYGKDSNSILYELMNVKERPDHVQEQINHCFQLIDDGRIKLAKQALNELSNLLGENDSEVVRANTLISFLEE